MITETLPKLQQYFLTQGVYIYFVDFHFNWHFDWTTNPYHLQRILDELHDAHRTSAGPFFLVRTKFSRRFSFVFVPTKVFLQNFVGNRYGSLVLPIELSTNEFQTIKNGAMDLGKGKTKKTTRRLPFSNSIETFLDVKLFERWYLFDEKFAPSSYRLKNPDEIYSNLFSRSNSTYELNSKENHEWIDVYNNLIDIFVSVLHDKPNSKGNSEILLLSANEIFFQNAMKLSPLGCLCVLRQFDGETTRFVQMINHQ